MMETHGGTESILQTGYLQEAQYYARALEVAKRIPSILKGGGNAEESLRQILELFHQVAAVEAHLAPFKERWRQSGQVPGPGLRAATDDVVHLLEQLVKQIGIGEEEAVALRDQMIPMLDKGIRVRRMQQAYGHGS